MRQSSMIYSRFIVVLSLTELNTAQQLKITDIQCEIFLPWSVRDTHIDEDKTTQDTSYKKAYSHLIYISSNKIPPTSNNKVD